MGAQHTIHCPIDGCDYFETIRLSMGDEMNGAVVAEHRHRVRLEHPHEHADAEPDE